MSTQCTRFEQNAWKKELCSNCFKPREEHAAGEESLKMNVGRLLVQMKTDNLKLQGILRDATVSEKDQKKKNVAFPECLTEVIGYGGDDVPSDAEEEDEQDFAESFSSEEDVAPDSEEERALGNLTRFNTNFNTITANLTEVVATNEANKTPATRPFASLMLGRIQKDSEGRKTTLLVSVTPFGGDESLPTAKRPTDRKINANGVNPPAKCKASENSIADSKPEITLKGPKKGELDQRKTDKPEQKGRPGLEKIVDMPLITSSNLISVIQRNEATETDDASLAKSNSETTQRTQDLKSEKKVSAASSRAPAIKKPEIEKPKVALQPLQNGARNEYDFVARVVKRPVELSRTGEESCTLDKGIELTLTPLSKSEADDAAESDRSMIIRGKDVNKITVIAVDIKKSAEISPVAELRNVEGEDTASEKRFNFEDSRELAGEPDGKADEEEMTEPPALPRSPPPIEPRPPLPGETSKPVILAMEPRPSFLHGAVNADVKIKPAVPLKPVTFTAKNIAPPDLSTKKPLTSTFSTSTFHSPANRIAQSTPQETALPKPAVKDKTDKLQSSAANLSRESSCNPPKEVDLRPSQIAALLSSPTTLGGLNVMAKLSPIHKPKPPPLNLTRDQADGGNASENADEDEDPEESQSARESIPSANKRRMAPRPPTIETIEDLTPSASLFARNPGASLKSDSPVVREKEKRERASSCSPKFRKAVSELPDPTSSVQTPDPASRRTISLSQDSLATAAEVREEKKRGRSRFSLKRFLRMGSRKDVDMIGGHGSSSRIDEIPSTPQPKPRLEIIHPLELDGAAVEVVGHDRVARISEDQTDSCGSRQDTTGRTTRSPPSARSQQAAVRPGKPPPPPRNQSLEDWSRLDSANKPVRPPPPRVDTKQLPPRSDKSSPSKSSSSSSASWQPAASSPSSDSIYANLGEVRSALAPSKPQRTASMRDQAASQPLLKKHAASTQALNQDYEAVHPPPASSDSPTSTDSHVYECLSSSPECDSNLELRRGGGGGGGVPHLTCKRKSDSSAMEPAVEFKFHHQPFVRSTSLPYCGSETESELYAPYAFYTGDEGPEEDQDWKSKEDELRISRLRQRRGRSIVHRSLEDNYGAVVVANHEALAQFLEQLNQVPQVPAGLRALKNANPRLSHFNVDATGPFAVARRIFYPATWNEQNVTLCIAFDLAAHVSRKEFYLAPVVEFVDSVPAEFLGESGYHAHKDTEANISVLPRLQVNSVHSFGSSSRGLQDEGTVREASFVLLQFVNALKSLQARGIEEASKSLSNVVLCREEKDACYRLYLLQGLNTDMLEERDEERVSLCQCALAALERLNLPERLPLVRELLMREKAVTLSQVKSLLEFSLWGPADVSLGGPREREVSLQRWLDLERANVLHALVKTRTPLTVTDEYQLLFLVRTSAKMMSEASLLLDDQRARLARAR